MEQFIGVENIEYIEVVSQVKSEMIAVVNHVKFRAVLQTKGLMPYGEDLEEEFQSLLCLSHNREDLLMIRKIK